MIQKYQIQKYLVWIGLVALIIWSLPVFEGSGRDLPFWQNAERLFFRFFPPDFSELPTLLEAFYETLRIGFAATLISALVSLVVGVLGGPWMPTALRTVVVVIFAAIRAVPSLLWAVVAVALVGPNALAGVIALSLYSMGYLGKFLIDDFESLDPSLLNVYRHWGLHPVMAFRFGFWPQLRQRFLRHCLWMFEYNIRSASIIGYVGAGGLGLQLSIYQEYGQWSRFSAVLICILGLVLVFEVIARTTRWKQKTSSPAKN